jgi:uncharacterized membrane protein YebE (DUF533 family)
MTNTTKLVLVGGGALVAVVLIARRMQSTAAAKPTGIAGAVAGVTQAVTSLKGIAYSSPKLAPGGLPYGPGATDGTAAVSDATGQRVTRALVPSSTQFYDPKLLGLA